jgi:hypothetical protein
MRVILGLDAPDEGRALVGGRRRRRGLAAARHPAAAFAVQQAMPAYSQVDSAYTPQYGYYPLSPLGGLAVLCAWAALALAALLLRRRDA